MSGRGRLERRLCSRSPVCGEENKRRARRKGGGASWAGQMHSFPLPPRQLEVMQPLFLQSNLRRPLHLHATSIALSLPSTMLEVILEQILLPRSILRRAVQCANTRAAVMPSPLSQYLATVGSNCIAGVHVQLRSQQHLSVAIEAVSNHSRSAASAPSAKLPSGLSHECNASCRQDFSAASAAGQVDSLVHGPRRTHFMRVPLPAAARSPLASSEAEAPPVATRSEPCRSARPNNCLHGLHSCGERWRVAVQVRRHFVFLSAQAGTSSRTVLRSGAAAADDDVPADVATTVWLQWPARSQRATGTARPSAGVNTSVAGLKPPSEIGDVVEIGDPHTCRDSWERPAVMLGGEQGNEPDGSNEVAGATTAADGAVEARSFARSSSSSSEGSGRGGVDRSSAQRRAAVIIPSGKNVAPHLLARLTTRTSEGHAMHHRPVALPTANTLSARTLPRPFSFLWARLLPGSPVLHQALLSEARGYGRALVLSTAEPCGHLRAPVADATGESRAAGGIVGAAAEASAAAAAAADDAEHSANDDEHEREQFGPDAAGTREAISIAAARHQAAVARAQSERSFDQCFRTLAPLLASSAVMPAAGAREASVAHGCGAEWARRWWPGGAWEGERVHAHAPSLAHDSSTSEASRPRFGCIAGSDGSSSARPLWYGFVKRRVLFLALSSAHSLAHTDEQHTELRRAARAARASGASFVVAYGERPSNVTSDASLRDLLAGMGADLYLCASASSSAATAPERSSVVASSLRESDERRLPRSHRGGKGSSSKMTAVVSLDGLPEDAYVRLSIADNRTALLVERVRALDGRVLDSFGVLAEPKKRVGKF